VNLAELRTALQERREDYSQSDAKLDRKINQVYKDICSRRRWGWLRRRHTYTTYGPFFYANTGADLNTPDASGIYVVGTQNGNRTISISQFANTPVTTFGKRVKIDGDFYRVANINSTGTTWTLDRPLRCAVTVGDPAVTANHSIKVIHNEMALPVGTLSVVQSTLYKGGATSYGTQLGIGAVGPEAMSRLDMDVGGQPSSFSTVRKEPIPPPRLSPTLTVSAGSGLEIGTYTYWYSYLDKQTGAESALGPASTITIATGTLQNVTIGADAARTDFLIRLYRSTVNGTIPYLVADEQGTSFTAYVDRTPDEYLSTHGPSSASTMYMQFYPVPDAEYEVHSLIQIEPQPLGGDNDYPLFDSQFHHVILDGAEAMMLEASDEQGRANQARQRYEVSVARMIQMDRMNQQRKVVFGGAKQPRGKPTWWYGAFTP
jgi:hypothetical protein